MLAPPCRGYIDRQSRAVENDGFFDQVTIAGRWPLFVVRLAGPPPTVLNARGGFAAPNNNNVHLRAPHAVRPDHAVRSPTATEGGTDEPEDIATSCSPVGIGCGARIRAGQDRRAQRHELA